MNQIISALLLAIIQAVTEWIPVSSSGHLVLFTNIFGFDGGLGFDVAMHFATLIAVVVYFFWDLFFIARDFATLKRDSENWRLGWMLILATIPGAAAGFFFRDIFAAAFESLIVVAIGFGITGLVLMIASMSPVAGNKKMVWWKALLIGCAQAVAIVPGISRSGSTMGSGLILGLSEKQAMKFSFLMSVPIIFGAFILNYGEVIWDSTTIVAAVVAFFTGLITIHVLFRYVLSQRRNLMWFGAYALLAAIGLILWLLILGL